MNKQIIYWYRKYVPEAFQKFFKTIKPKWFDYFKLDYLSRKNIDFSGHGETEAVKNFLNYDSKQINYYVDIGASDGVSSSSTLEFAKDHKWSGLSIEYECHARPPQVKRPIRLKHHKASKSSATDIGLAIAHGAYVEISGRKIFKAISSSVVNWVGWINARHTAVDVWNGQERDCDQLVAECECGGVRAGYNREGQYYYIVEGDRRDIGAKDQETGTTSQIEGFEDQQSDQ